LRSVYAVIPSLPAPDRIAAHSDECSFWCSRTRRNARSHSSGGYRVPRVMAPSSQTSEPPRNAGRFTGYPSLCWFSSLDTSGGHVIFQAWVPPPPKDGSRPARGPCGLSWMLGRLGMAEDRTAFLAA
jgi:hypothetical protein